MVSSRCRSIYSHHLFHAGFFWGLLEHTRLSTLSLGLQMHGSCWNIHTSPH